MIVPHQEPYVTQAADALKAGQLVVMPTETVYGLAANAENDAAVSRIYAAKDRPHFNPLIVHVADMAMAKHYGVFNANAVLLTDVFWPGPLTLVVRRRDSGLSHLATAGLDTVALRSPAHPVARQLLEKLDFGLAAPSANRSGRISPTTAQHAEDEVGGQVAFVLDGGACDVGLESTVVDVTGNTAYLLRLGCISPEMILKRTGLQVRMETHADHAPRSPGMLLKHYAPQKPLRINTTHVRENEALIAFGQPLDSTGVVFQLSATENLGEAAANLFAMLRAADSSDCSAIAVMPVPEHGIGAAINDRLRRAVEK